MKYSSCGEFSKSCADVEMTSLLEYLRRVMNASKVSLKSLTINYCSIGFRKKRSNPSLGISINLIDCLNKFHCGGARRRAQLK